MQIFLKYVCPFSVIVNQICDKHHAFRYVAIVHFEYGIENLIDCLWQFNVDKILMQ